MIQSAKPIIPLSLRGKGHSIAPFSKYQNSVAPHPVEIVANSGMRSFSVYRIASV